jgi:hypothetical protein
MKKITKPAAKTSAPASKADKPAKAVAKKAAAPVAAVKKTAPTPAPAPAVKAVKAKAAKAAPVAPAAELVPPAPKSTKAPKVVKPAPAPKVEAKAEAEPVPSGTTIVAAVDVGFGNVLTLRGEGAGLSWDAGIALECAAGDRWTITLPASESAPVFKFLINDSVWSVGENYTVASGSSVVLTPVF